MLMHICTESHTKMPYIYTMQFGLKCLHDIKICFQFSYTMDLPVEGKKARVCI